MHLRFPRSWRVTGIAALALALSLGVAGGMLRAVPVASQTVSLEVLQAPSAVNESDPWAAVWDRAPKQEVPLSLQIIAPPFGGGAVSTLTARGFLDNGRLFLLLEWADATPNDTVSGSDEFADAAAVQFPGGVGTVPPFTMGGPGANVNIWQWKALWQADMERGFDTSATRYPNTYVDLYPGGDDPINRPALAAGNPLSVRDHDSPVENLIAEGFGTLTHADVQDVNGAGVWRAGRWRALFSRPLTSGAAGMAHFEPGETTSVAFAVWDGGAGERNGLKSFAPWINLNIGEPGEASAIGAAEGGGNSAGLILLFGAIVAAGVVAYLFTLRSNRGVEG